MKYADSLASCLPKITLMFLFVFQLIFSLCQWLFLSPDLRTSLQLIELWAKEVHVQAPAQVQSPKRELCSQRRGFGMKKRLGKVKYNKNWSISIFSLNYFGIKRSIISNSVVFFILLELPYWQFSLRHSQNPLKVKVPVQRPVTSLGHQEGRSEEFSGRGPNFLNYVQYFQTISNTFFQGGENSKGGFPHPGYVSACTS